MKKRLSKPGHRRGAESDTCINKTILALMDNVVPNLFIT